MICGRNARASATSAAHPRAHSQETNRPAPGAARAPACTRRGVRRAAASRAGGAARTALHAAPMASPAPAAPPFSPLADFRNALLRQLDNSFVGGSVALAAASALLSLAWRALRWLATALHDTAFTRYELPVGSPQCIAAARFLQAHAGGRTARRLVLDARAARLAADVTARGALPCLLARAAAAAAQPRARLARHPPTSRARYALRGLRCVAFLC